MYKTMKQIILIAIGLISLLPVSAQVLSKEESAKLGNTLENLAREGQRKHREEVMAKQRKQQQRAAEIENRTQLGLQQNQQQVQRLQDNYGVDDLRQRNGESRPHLANVLLVDYQYYTLKTVEKWQNRFCVDTKNVRFNVFNFWLHQNHIDMDWMGAFEPTP